MDRIKISVNKRQDKGKGPARRLRKVGIIPAICYSSDMSVSLSVPVESLKVLNSVKFSESAIIDMHIVEDEGKATIPVLIKDIQFNPINESVTHIDFLKVSLKEKIKVHVPITLKGESKGVKDEEGVLTQVLREVEVEGLPLDIPKDLEVDVTELTIGHSIHVEQLTVPESITIVTDVTATIVTVTAKKEEIIEEVPVEGEEVQEPEVIKEKKDESTEDTKDTKEETQEKAE
tara:strand:+ start:1697 stop:2392 length:696 start_codon:yes stop_codon:yes gene_type:complete